MTIRCKFKCTETRKTEGWKGAEILNAAKFEVVHDDSEDNQKFFAATPAGTLELSIVKNEFFQPGKEYFINIEEAVPVAA